MPVKEPACQSQIGGIEVAADGDGAATPAVGTSTGQLAARAEGEAGGHLDSRALRSVESAVIVAAAKEMHRPSQDFHHAAVAEGGTDGVGARAG